MVAKSDSLCSTCGHLISAHYDSGKCWFSDCPCNGLSKATQSRNFDGEVKGLESATFKATSGAVAEHQCDSDCRIVMAIRNTNITEGVAIYKQSIADEVDVARIAELEYVRDHASGGGSWRRVIDMRIATISEGRQ